MRVRLCTVFMGIRHRQTAQHTPTYDRQIFFFLAKQSWGPRAKFEEWRRCVIPSRCDKRKWGAFCIAIVNHQKLYISQITSGHLFQSILILRVLGESKQLLRHWIHIRVAKHQAKLCTVQGSTANQWIATAETHPKHRTRSTRWKVENSLSDH